MESNVPPSSDNHLVVMAGGLGTRLWPLSTTERPKQFTDPLARGCSLLQATLRRLAPLVGVENTWVVTSRQQAPLVREQLPQLPQGNILTEPSPHGTAPCVAYASWKIKSINPNANIIVTPSDHLVLDEEEFRRVIASSLRLASESDAIVTVGITPTRPETGYGYIEVDPSAACPRNQDIYRTLAFHEKPDLETAKSFLESANYCWNAGIFVWNVSTIVNALRIYAHPISKAFEELLPVYGTEGEQEAVDRVYDDLPNISIDHAVLEKADEVFCCPASFGWSDLGSWTSLWENSERDRFDNAVSADAELTEVSACIISAPKGKRIVVEGLVGYVVADTPDGLLIRKLARP